MIIVLATSLLLAALAWLVMVSATPPNSNPASSNALVRLAGKAGERWLRLYGIGA